jgi:hypothetical protein
MDHVHTSLICAQCTQMGMHIVGNYIEKGALMWCTLFQDPILIWFTWINMLWLVKKFLIIWGLPRIKVWIVHGVDHDVANYGILAILYANPRS